MIDKTLEAAIRQAKYGIEGQIEELIREGKMERRVLNVPRFEMPKMIYAASNGIIIQQTPANNSRVTLNPPVYFKNLAILSDNNKKTILAIAEKWAYIFDDALQEQTRFAATIDSYCLNGGCLYLSGHVDGEEGIFEITADEVTQSLLSPKLLNKRKIANTSSRSIAILGNILYTLDDRSLKRYSEDELCEVSAQMPPGKLFSSAQHIYLKNNAFIKDALSGKTICQAKSGEEIRKHTLVYHNGIEYLLYVKKINEQHILNLVRLDNDYNYQKDQILEMSTTPHERILALDSCGEGGVLIMTGKRGREGRSQKDSSYQPIVANLYLFSIHTQQKTRISCEEIKFKIPRNSAAYAAIAVVN